MLKEIEALLYITGDEGITLNELKNILEINNNDLLKYIDQLNNHLQKESCLEVYKKENRFFLTTQKKYANILKKYSNNTLNKRISKASLEVLAIIAYKQPITRLEIDQIRGVNSSGSIQKLLMYNLIQDLGKSDTPGRARLFGTTNYFLEYFNLDSLDDLPQIEISEQNTIETNSLFEEFDDLVEGD